MRSGPAVVAAWSAAVFERCPEFDDWWQCHEVRRPRSGRKTLHHPEKGVIALDHPSFQTHDDPDVRLVIYSPVAG